MSEIVKYNNHMNELSFKDFNDYDLNFLMAICAKMKELGEGTQYFEYNKLMEILDWDMTKSIDIFHKDLKRMSDKLRQVGATIDISPNKFSSFNLFSDFEGDKEKRILTVRINPKFKHILNELTSNFTRFELAEYVHLDGKYSKLLYQHLKQYRTTGWWRVSIDDLRQALSIPESMPNMNITPKVINPSIEVIKTCKGFGELKVEVIRSARRGRAVEGYYFTWTAENQIPGQMTLEEYISKKKPQPKAKRANKNSHDYDYDELEREALKWQNK